MSTALLVGYRKRHGLSQAAFAQRMTDAGAPVSQALVSFWELGRKPVSAERCAQIERVTGGEIRRVDLRPDLFGTLVAPAPEAHDMEHAA